MFYNQILMGSGMLMLHLLFLHHGTEPKEGLNIPGASSNVAGIIYTVEIGLTDLSKSERSGPPGPLACPTGQGYLQDYRFHLLPYQCTDGATMLPPLNQYQVHVKIPPLETLPLAAK